MQWKSSLLIYGKCIIIIMCATVLHFTSLYIIMFSTISLSVSFAYSTNFICLQIPYLILQVVLCFLSIKMFVFSHKIDDNNRPNIPKGSHTFTFKIKLHACAHIWQVIRTKLHMSCAAATIQSTYYGSIHDRLC